MVAPNAKYTAEKARRRLLRMPLVSICIGDSTKGMSFTVIMEHCHGVDYSKMSLVINGMRSFKTSKNPRMLEKDCVKILLRLAQSDRERECIKYAVCKTSGISATGARCLYGFENMDEGSSRVEQAIAEVQQIYEVVEDIASIRDKVALATLGVSASSQFSRVSIFTWAWLGKRAIHSSIMTVVI